MIPFGNENITIIRRVESVRDGKTHVSYEKNVVSGCSWHHVSVVSRIDSQLRRGVETSCRMPPKYMPKPGDVLVRGRVDALPANAVEQDYILESSDAFRVTSVKDNTRNGFPIPHYAVKGE